MLRKTTLKEGARQRENSKGENVKSGMGNQEKVFIGTKAFNEKEAGKTFPIPPSNSHMCRLGSQTVKQFVNWQVIITAEHDSLVQCSF